ncbi:MAG: hypothetical protein B7Y07_02825 [Halothiobacillus sp. 24-54-40]|nr:MAG: hypothetical protein B7Y07_02825 [Halothiobacillus sp. 24-54-40]OZA81271.1 MAG: hypothetical protein B7X64_02410 [Halothiobacillus sp. 39-53-45]
MAFGQFHQLPAAPAPAPLTLPFDLSSCPTKSARRLSSPARNIPTQGHYYLVLKSQNQGIHYDAI